MWPFSRKQKDAEVEVINLRIELERVEDDYDELKRKYKKLTEVINAHKLLAESLEHDFNFDSVYRVISIEYSVIENSMLVKCAICYMIVEPIIANDNIKTEPSYREWFCTCTVDQYTKLYNKYIKYKKEVYKYE